MSNKMFNGEVGSWAIREGGNVALYVRIYEDVSETEVGEKVRDHNGTITDSFTTSPTFVIELPKEEIVLLAKEDIISWIEEIPPPATPL
jgi:hypothetical protein